MGKLRGKSRVIIWPLPGADSPSFSVMAIEISSRVVGVGDAFAVNPAKGNARRARNFREACMAIC